MPLNLEPVQSGYNLSVINENFQRIEDTWDEKVDRLSSTQNNYMEQEFDMNSNHIINHPAPRDSLDLVRLKEINDTLILSGAQGVVPLIQPRQTGDGVTKQFASPNTFSVTPNTMIVNIDGVSQRAYTDFIVVGPNIIEFTDAPPLESDIDITYFEPQIVAENGASGTFLSQDSKTVTVVNGLITSIV